MARNPGGRTTGSATKRRRARPPSSAAAPRPPTPEAASEVQFRAVLEALGDGFIALDPSYRCTYVNPAAAVLLNTTAAALTGRPIWEALGPAREAQLHERITRAAEQKLPGKFEEYCERCDHWFRWHCHPTENGLAIFMEDITELRQAERALQHSEHRFRKLFEADLMGIFITRADGTFLDCNEALAKMLGYDSRAEILRHRSSDFYVDPEFRAEAVRTLQTQGIYLGREGRMWRKDGSIAHLLGAAVLLRDEETGEPYIQGVAVDITERRRAEEALRESEQRYRKLFEANLAGVYLAKLDGTILDFNEAMMKMLGYDSRAEVFQHRVADFYVHPELRQELIRRLQQDGIVQGWELLLRKKDGSDLCALGSATLLLDERTGEPYIQGAALDVTDRRRAEEALRENEESLRLALEGGQMGRWEWDLRTDSISWCERSSKLLDLAPPARIPVAAFLACVHSDDRAAVQRRMTQALQREADLEMEFRVLQGPRESQANVRWLASRGKVIRDARGQAVRMIGVMFDITRRKRLEESLRQVNDRLAEEVQSQTEQLRTTTSRVQVEAVRRVSAESELRRQSQMLEGFFQHTITPLAFLDRQFQFIRVNQAFAHAGGHEPDYFTGRNYFDVYPQDRDRAIFERVLRTQRPYFARAKPTVHPDHPARPVTYWDWQLTPLLDEAGQVQFLVLNSEDVTQQQQAFVELEHRARQLQRLMLDLTQAEDRERRRLADILHDDLQQLLAAAKFHLSLLDNGTRSRADAREIVHQAKEIIRDAIEKSRSLSHELSPAILYQGSLDETFDWLAREMRKKYGLTVHVETAGPVELPSEPLRAFLFRATQELLFNVVKHARVNEATIRVRRRRQYLCVSVSDRGRGFDPRQLKEIAGFGLLSVRERAELLGGRMRIRSAPGRGSTFSIVVPAGEKQVVSSSRTSVAGEEGADGPVDRRLPATDYGLPLRVLLADDHEIVRQGIAALLREEATIEVVGEAAEGRAAINLAYQLRPDVIIMDVSMPVMNGEEATRQIRRLLPEIRVVALSMYEEPETIERMCQAGAADYVLKTAPPEELLAAIRGRTSAS